MATPNPERSASEGALVAEPSNWNYAAVLRTVASMVPERPAI